MASRSMPCAFWGIAVIAVGGRTGFCRRQFGVVRTYSSHYRPDGSAESLWHPSSMYSVCLKKKMRYVPILQGSASCCRVAGVKWSRALEFWKRCFVVRVELKRSCGIETVSCLEPLLVRTPVYGPTCMESWCCCCCSTDFHVAARRRELL